MSKRANIANERSTSAQERAAPEILHTAVFSLQTPDGNGGEAILHIKSNCSGRIFFKLLF